MINDALLLFAAAQLERLSEPGGEREEGDYLAQQIEQTLSRAPLNVEGKEAEYSPRGWDEAKLLFAYINFLGHPTQHGEIDDLAAEIHAWFLERLSVTPAIMSPRWRSRFEESFDSWNLDDFSGDLSQSVLVRPFIELADASCRYLAVRALLRFDEYSSISIDAKPLEESAVGLLWRPLDIAGREKDPERPGVPDWEALLTDLSEILLDAVVLDSTPEGVAWRALGQLASFAREANESFRVAVESSMLERARFVGGELSELLMRLIDQGRG